MSIEMMTVLSILLLHLLVVFNKKGHGCNTVSHHVMMMMMMMMYNYQMTLHLPALMRNNIRS